MSNTDVLNKGGNSWRRHDGVVIQTLRVVISVTEDGIFTGTWPHGQKEIFQAGLQVVIF